MQPGDTIYFLSEYNWEIGTLVSIGRVNYKLEYNFCGKLVTLLVKKEKAAFPDESVAVVWECWKGRNGRGAYRVERELYPQFRIPAKNIARQGMTDPGRVTERQYSVLGA
jgi:hypothetical protein